MNNYKSYDITTIEINCNDEKNSKANWNLNVLVKKEKTKKL